MIDCEVVSVDGEFAVRFSERELPDIVRLRSFSMATQLVTRLSYESSEEDDPVEMLHVCPSVLVTECFQNARLRYRQIDGQYLDCLHQRIDDTISVFTLFGNGIYRYDELLTHDETDGPRNGYIEIRVPEGDDLGTFRRIIG